MSGFVYAARWIGERKSIAKTIPPHWIYNCHTYRCFREQRKSWVHLSGWLKQWPNSCEECDGWGITQYEENRAPLGSGHYWPETMTDLCGCIAPNDIEEMLCPRCGKQLYKWIVEFYQVGDSKEWLVGECGNDGKVEAWLEVERQCPSCGWNWGKGKDDTRPGGLFECSCEFDIPYSTPGKWQRWLFERFGERFKKFKHPIMILAGEED